MAETVKKSRIVSEDDLEESLMQEFNMRLKTCMSSDKLNDDDEKNDTAEEEAIYENVEIITSNGKREEHHTPAEEENEPLGQRNKLNSIEEFIQIERECLRLEQNGLIEENEHVQLSEENNELLGPEEEEEQGEAEEDLRVTDLDQGISEVDNVENIEIMETLEMSEPVIETKSVRDRMFLSTDSASCLLFTQTVTSPMLTPSEERIDFIKGFQTSTQNTISDDSNGSPKSPIEAEEMEVEDNVQEGKVENIVEAAVEKVDTLEEAVAIENVVEDEFIVEEEKFVEEERINEKDNRNVEEIEIKIQKEEVIGQDFEEYEVIEDDKYEEEKKEELHFEEDKQENLSVEEQNKSDLEEEQTHIEEDEVVEMDIKSVDLLKDVPENYSNGHALEEVEEIISTKPEVVDMKARANPKQKYIETITKETTNNKEQKVTECKLPSIKSLKDQYIMTATSESPKSEKNEISSLKTLDIMKQISKFEQISPGKEEGDGNLKSSFSKFDALQKKNVLHVRSSDSSKAQEKFNGNQIDNTNCKSCGKIVFQMEQMKAEKSIWHKNCFRCTECNKQLTVDTYQSHEGVLYCKPHFKTLFAPKVVEDETPPSDKPDLGLEELQSLNVKERFQVFEHHEEESSNQLERTGSAVNVKRSSSILSKLARFQAKGMDIGVTDDSLNGIPIEESSSEGEEEEEELDGEDADLIRAKRAQREKPFHFVGMSDVKSKWEQGADQNGRDERREERKQEIQSIRNRLFMGKQGKMKEAYQQAVMESESGTKLKNTETIEMADTRSLKEKFEKGQLQQENKDKESLEAEDMSVFESGICKKSRSIFLELDANAAKAPQISPVSPIKTSNDVRKAREVYLAKQTSEEVVKSTEPVEDITVQTADIQQRFKFFETYREPEKKKKQFRITPPREGQVKVDSPEREVYRDPDVVRGEEIVEDSVIAKQTQTAKKMLNKFKQMEEDLSKDQVPLGPKPLKRFTPPPEPIRSESESEEDMSETEEESEEEDAIDHSRIPDEDLIEAQKAARAKQLRAKFEKWEANEIKREQNQSSVNIAEEFGEEQSQIESTKSLRARFESMKSGSKEESKSPRIKVNRFVDTTSTLECCQDCKMRVYPLEKISVHGAVYHKKCFKCMECHTILRMDSYSYNQGLLYCTPHFKRLFITKGNYDTAFGLEQHKEKWNTTVA